MNISRRNTDRNLIEFITLSIELCNNKTEFLKIYKDSIPDKLAYEFCLKHNLDFSSLKKLTNEIKKALNEAKKRQKINNSYDKINKTSLENISHLKNSSSMKDIYKDNKINENKNKTDIKYEYNNNRKYNFKDISKNLKRPIIYQFKITIKNEKNPKNSKLKTKKKKFK